MARFKYVITESANGVQTITLNRPEKRNALYPLLIEELTLALREAESCDCGIVILTGAGSAFCAGLDMEYLETMNASTPTGTPPRLREHGSGPAHALRLSQADDCRG